MTAEEVFVIVRSACAGEPAVEPGTGFGRSPGLRVDGRIFAMQIRDRIVFKLPAGRSEELRAGGCAEAFRVGRKEMREWVELAPDADVPWGELAREARGFVAASRG